MLTSKHITALLVWLALQAILIALAVAAVMIPTFTRPILAALVALLLVELILYVVWRRKTRPTSHPGPQ